MKKSILNIGTVLKKIDQKLIYGGNNPLPPGPDDPVDPVCIKNYICYAPSSSFCGTCQELFSLPTKCLTQVISHAECF